MNIEEYKCLKNYNTFGVAVKARYFVSVTSISQLREMLRSDLHKHKFILGGGSNILFTKDIDALVLHLNLKGIEEENIDENHIALQVQAGENWHKLVRYCVAKNYGGIENLSLIPGNAGTAPIQNIGAYGVEIKDVLESCKVLDKTTSEIKTLSVEDCRFAYRHSIFKSDAKDRYVILSIRLKLTRKNHKLHMDYGDIKNELKRTGCYSPSILDISDAVIRIRQSKLPDPKELGNGGSFFKNPILTEKEFQVFHTAHPEATFYKLQDNTYKIPAGWLIEHAGLKGYRQGDAGVHRKQALVLVNYGTASGENILDLAKYIQKTVRTTYNISIAPEINIL